MWTDSCWVRLDPRENHCRARRFSILFYKTSYEDVYGNGESRNSRRGVCVVVGTKSAYKESEDSARIGGAYIRMGKIRTKVEQPVRLFFYNGKTRTRAGGHAHLMYTRFWLLALGKPSRFVQ